MASPTDVYLMSIPFLAAFAFGMYRRISFYLEGSLEGNGKLTKAEKSARVARLTASAFLSRRVLLILEAIGLDFIAGRRAYRENKLRWAMHSLILWGFLGLMIFDLAEVTYIRRGIGEDTVKDLPHMAFAFDLFGTMMIAGVLIATVRRAVFKVSQLQNTPEDVAAIVILATVIISGYLAEGFRFLLQDTPPEVTRYAFVGHLIAKGGTPGSQWGTVFQLFWYLHALASLSFIAYIPFGKFMHLFASPVVIAVNNMLAQQKAHSEANEPLELLR